jgi:hypothetical protein
MSASQANSITAGVICGPEEIKDALGGSNGDLQYWADLSTPSGRRRIHFRVSEGAFSSLSRLVSHPRDVMRELLEEHLAQQMAIGVQPADESLGSNAEVFLYQARSNSKAYANALISAAASIFEAAVTVREHAVISFFKNLDRERINNCDYERITMQLAGPSGSGSVSGSQPSPLFMYQALWLGDKSRYEHYLGQQFDRAAKDFPEAWREYLKSISQK